MNEQKLYIKNMVCDRCKMIVKQEMEKLALEPISIKLGEITVRQQVSEQQRSSLKNVLGPLGFELIDDQKSRIISQIKSLIIELIHHGGENKLKLKYSTYLSKELGRDYTYLSHLFSEVESTTIEQYIIHQKIERAKELLVYGEKNISEIAIELNYSSVAHLSNQFKKVTGLTPTHFKSIGLSKRKPLDKV